MSARNERAKDVAVVGVMVVIGVFWAAAIIGGVLTGHYEPLLATLILAPIAAFLLWVTS